MTKQKTAKLEWSRWNVIGGTDPRDISPSEYEGPVVFQRHGSTRVYHGECNRWGITQDGARVLHVRRWQPAPVEMIVGR